MLLGGMVLALVAAAPEYTLSLRQDEWRVRVTIRPGEPQPGKLVELTFDVGRQKDSDTDPQALNDAKLGLTMTGPGRRLRVVAPALGDAGVYAAHWTPSAKGLWTLQLSPYAGQGPNVTFQIGAGVPMPASALGHAVQSSRVVVGAAPGGQPAVKQLMAELGERWLEATDVERADPAALKAMASLLRAVKGRVPKESAKDGAEYDKLAEDTAAALEHAQSRAEVQANGSNGCLACHLKFRDGWVQDLSKWPEVTAWRR